jgi:hypothetical protein
MSIENVLLTAEFMIMLIQGGVTLLQRRSSDFTKSSRCRQSRCPCWFPGGGRPPPVKDGGLLVAIF